MEYLSILLEQCSEYIFRVASRVFPDDRSDSHGRECSATSLRDKIERLLTSFDYRDFEVP